MKQNPTCEKQRTYKTRLIRSVRIRDSIEISQTMNIQCGNHSFGQGAIIDTHTQKAYTCLPKWKALPTILTEFGCRFLNRRREKEQYTFFPTTRIDNLFSLDTGNSNSSLRRIKKNIDLHSKHAEPILTCLDSHTIFLTNMSQPSTIYFHEV